MNPRDFEKVSGFVDLDGAVFGGEHVCQRLQDLIIHRNQRHGLAGNRFGFGHNPGQDVADVPCGLARSHHDRPVTDDNAGVTFPRNVFGRKDPDDAAHFFRCRAVDLEHLGPGMVTEF